MRKTSYVLILFLGFIGSKNHFTQIPVSIFEEEAAIGTEEDPQARAAFERLQLQNPITHEVPEDIRRKELAFSSHHITRAQFNSNRVDGLLEETWELAGPFNVGGRTRAVALDVTNESIILAGGVSGGIWKSTNDGSTWRRTSDPELRNSVTTLAQDTRAGKEHIWYYGTGELLGNSPRGGGAPYRGDGIFKSTDSGESWAQLAFTNDANPSEFGSQFQYIWRIVTDRTNSTNDVVLAAAFGGILRSEDGGDTWDNVLGEKLFDLDPGTNLNEKIAPFYTDVHQTSAGDFYAFLSDQTPTDQSYPGGMYWSQDGIDWQKIGFSSSSNFGRAVIDSSGDNVYYFASVNDKGLLYRYTSTGVTSGVITGNWTDLTGNLPDFDGLGDLDIQTGYNMMIKVHPANENTLFLGATNLYRSKDAFATKGNTTWIGGYSEEDDGSLYKNHHPDQHDLIFYPSNPDRMISANDGGLHRTNSSVPSTVVWTPLNNGYVTSQFYTINIPKDETSDVISGGLQDNGSWMNISKSENAVWYPIIGGDGGYTASVPFGLYWYFSFQNSQIYRVTLNTNLGLTSFARVDPTGGPDNTGGTYMFINPYVLDPTNANIMYLAGGNTIWKNSNLAQIPTGSQETTSTNWQLLNQTKSTTGSISALEISAASKYLYYGSSNGELFRLTDTGSNTGGVRTNIWQTNFPVKAYVSCIASNPEDDDEIMVIFSNYGVPSIFLSTNAGDSFVDVSGNLEEFVDGTGNGPSIRWAEIVPLTIGNRYFVGTSVGLYSTNELNGSSTTWVKESPESIGKSVVMMMDYRTLDGALVVATHGNGVFRTKVSGAKIIQPGEVNAPDRFATSKSFPNPFKTKTQIEFDIPETNYLKVDIYDVHGSIIKNLFLGPQFAGTSVVTWDGTDQQGQPVKGGLYIYRIYYDGIIKGGKMIFEP